MERFFFNIMAPAGKPAPGFSGLRHSPPAFALHSHLQFGCSVIPDSDPGSLNFPVQLQNPANAALTIPGAKKGERQKTTF